jgi:hypothetical protein
MQDAQDSNSALDHKYMTKAVGFGSVFTHHLTFGRGEKSDLEIGLISGYPLRTATSAVNHEIRARHVGRVLPREKQRAPRNLTWLPYAALKNGFFDQPHRTIISQKIPLGRRGDDHPGAHKVHASAQLRALRRKLFRHRQYAALGCRVRDAGFWSLVPTLHAVDPTKMTLPEVY